MLKNRNIIIKENTIIECVEGKETKKAFTLTHKSFIEQLKNIRIEKPKYYCLDDAFENQLMPPFVYIYYRHIYLYGKVPNLIELKEEYLEFFCEKVNGKIWKVKKEYSPSEFSFDENVLHGRLYRAIFSFYRETDLLLLLKENPLVQCVEYNFITDYKDGIDILVKINGETFGIVSRLKSFRSDKWKKVKNTKRHDYSNFKIIDVVFDRNNSYSCNNINLHKKEQIKKTIHTTQKIIKENCFKERR